MCELIGWILAPIYITLFWTIIIVFHPVQMIALKCGYLVHKISVDVIDLLLLLNLRVTGAKYVILRRSELPADRPLIVISNHQSLYDIPLLGWVFRKHHPKYVSKKELGRWIPSVSFNLRHGGSVLIDRNNPRRSVTALAKFGEYIEKNRYAACIFPEGTRARDGVMKPFKAAGAVTLLQHVPSAVVVPVAIDGSWKLAQHGFFPVPYGTRFRCVVLEPIIPEGRNAREIIQLAEERIRAELEAGQQKAGS